MANGSPDVSLTVLNDANKEAVVYTGTETVLDVLLTNNSDAITLTAGTSASSLNIFLPEFFRATVQKMSISLLNWEYSVNADDVLLVLTYKGPSPANWDKGQKIAFKITGVQSNESPATDSVQINFVNMGGSVPSQVQTPLSLANAPGKIRLRDVLQVTLDNQGSVYVSTENDPLRNKLFLNFKNIGTEPLYSGKSHWSGTPQVSVMFVYGNTSGALAPDDNLGPHIGSAWNITGTIDVDQTGGWKITKASTQGTHPHPLWLLAPIDTNEEIIGTGANANVTFEFSEIVSLLAPGHTQAIVQFSGFMKDENSRYDDTVFVVDIAKQEPPPTRGLLHFFGEHPIVTITQPKPINIDLGWAMLDVAAVHLICSFPGVDLVKKEYPNRNDPLAYDSCTITIPAKKESGAIFFTLQSFNGNGGYLNSMQFTVFVNAVMFVDPRDGRIYPTVLLNNQYWMAENLAHDEKESYAYVPDDGRKFGRLYTAHAESVTKPPDGWRIPSQKDWQGLFDKYGTAEAAYKALIDGGASGFGAKLGGFRDDGGTCSKITEYGYYRTTSSDGLYASFSATSQSVSLAGKFAGTYAISIRYVRDL